MNEPIKNSMRLRVRLLWATLFFGSAIYFGWQADYVVAALCAAGGVGGFSGYRVGALSLLSSVVAIGIAIAYAPSIGVDQEFRFHQWFGTTGLTNRFLSVGLVGFLISAAVTVSTWFIVGRLVRNRRSLDRINRWAGFVFGVAQGVVTVVLLIGGMLVIESQVSARAAQRDLDEIEQPVISTFVLAITDATRASQIGPTLVEYNPLIRIPQLNKLDDVQRTAQVLSDPGKIEELMRHPSIRELQQHKSVKRVMEELNADPQVREILNSGQSMSPQMAMTLLSHPAVLELIDQPGFLDEAVKVIQSSTIVPAYAN